MVTLIVCLHVAPHASHYADALQLLLHDLLYWVFFYGKTVCLIDHSESQGAFPFASMVLAATLITVVSGALHAWCYRCLARQLSLSTWATFG